MAFQYVASTSDGRLVQGVLDATEEASAEQALESAGYRVLQLQPVRRGWSWEELFPTLAGVNAADVVAFVKQLTILLESGTPLLTAVRVLREQAVKAAMRTILTGIGGTIQTGNTLSSALRHYPYTFNQLTVQMVEVGERSGTLEHVLRQLASHMERERTLAKKLMKALTYPAIVMAVAVVVVILIVTLVLPQISRVFLAFHAQLPWTTLVLIRSSSFLTANGFYLLMAILGLALGIGLYIRHPAGRRHFHGLMLSLPLLGSVVRLQATARLSRTLAMLLHAGVPMSDSLTLAYGTVSNVVLREALGKAREQFLQGEGLAKPLGRIPYLPPLFRQLVQVGEESGTLETSLAHAADAYEEEVEERAEALVSLVEPVMTLGIGLLVGFIALSVILPMFSITSVFKK